MFLSTIHFMYNPTLLVNYSILHFPSQDRGGLASNQIFNYRILLYPGRQLNIVTW